MVQKLALPGIKIYKAKECDASAGNDKLTKGTGQRIQKQFPYLRELYDKCIIVNQREKCE